MDDKLLIIGTGGHGKAVLDCVLASRAYASISFATNADEHWCMSGFPVVDERSLTPDSIACDYSAVVVAIGDNSVRLEKLRKLSGAGANLPVMIHPSAQVSRFARIGRGTVVLANAVVNAFAEVGTGCILNTASVVEHDCVVGDGAHLSPNSALGGGTRVGERVWLCIGSNVADHVNIASDSILAAGSCLVHDAEEPGLYAGVPAALKRRA